MVWLWYRHGGSVLLSCRDQRDQEASVTVLRAVDLMAVLDLSSIALEVRDYTQVPALLAALRRLVGCTAATLTHLDLRTQHEVAVFWPPSRPGTLALSAYPGLASTHPLRRPVADFAAGRPALTGPLRISDVQSGREWRATPLHREVLRDAADQMCLLLSLRGSAVRAITLSRESGTFTDRQRDLLAACAPHLRAALSRAHYKNGTGLQVVPRLAVVPLSTAPGLGAVPAGEVPGALSNREREVLDLVAEGLTDAQIARRLGLRPATVSKHLHRIYVRLGLRNRADATRYLSAQNKPRYDR
jgi:DNA-binding CsgD family transcriptional regulator